MEEGSWHMGSIVNDGDVYKAVEGVIYSTFSLIILELVEHDEQAADEWMRLTAQGMRCTVGSLAARLMIYNREKMAHLRGRYGETARDD